MELAAGDYNGDIYPELSQGRWDLELA